MKVQKSFAGSLQLLVEDDSYSGKPLKVSVVKKLPLELIIEPAPDVAMHKDDSDKRNQRMECSAENAVGKTSIPSVQSVSRPSNCRPQSTPTVTDDTKISPWCFHQPTGQQWLIPVMSPSEGLIYKPYNPGHGFAGPLCSGYGLPGSNPMMGNFRNPANDFPSSYHHYQPPVVSHGYFPPYGMPFLSPVNSGSAVEQANHFAGLGSRSQTNQLSGGGANFSTQRQQRPCTVPTQKNNDTVISNAVKPHAATKECELQGSTVSSHATEARNSLPQLHGTDQPMRVIKVVPHNAVSATESVARIFQCIQQERKQQESD